MASKLFQWALEFLGVALVAGALALAGLVADAAAIAEVVFLVVVVLVVAFLVLGTTAREDGR